MMKNVVRMMKVNENMNFGRIGRVLAILLMACVLITMAPRAVLAGTAIKYPLSGPTSVTIAVGETKTVALIAPANTPYVYNVQWGQSPAAYAALSASGGFGSYWKQPARVILKGTKVGTTTLNITYKAFKKAGDPSSKVYQSKLTCKVTVKAPAKKTVALQKIVLNKTTLSLMAGNSAALSVSYTPANTTVNKAVAWSSSNTGVATVSGGKVTAKKAGTAIITARCSGKTATCKVAVKVAPAKAVTSAGTYKNVSDAYTYLNQFRMSKSNQWYWNSNNKTKTYTYGLVALKRNTALENTAKVRAKEAWTLYYEKKYRTAAQLHKRLDGRSCFTAYPSGLTNYGENLAWGQTTSKAVILDGYHGWAETNCSYQGQGHRRNMLDKGFTKVGIACFVKDGKTSWAMCLGR